MSYHGREFQFINSNVTQTLKQLLLVIIIHISRSWGGGGGGGGGSGGGSGGGGSSSTVLSVAFPSDNKLIPGQQTSLVSIIIHSVCYLSKIAAYCSRIQIFFHILIITFLLSLLPSLINTVGITTGKCYISQVWLWLPPVRCYKLSTLRDPMQLRNELEIFLKSNLLKSAGQM